MSINVKDLLTSTEGWHKNSFSFPNSTERICAFPDYNRHSDDSTEILKWVCCCYMQCVVFGINGKWNIPDCCWIVDVCVCVWRMCFLVLFRNMVFWFSQCWLSLVDLLRQPSEHTHTPAPHKYIIFSFVCVYSIKYRHTWIGWIPKHTSTSEYRYNENK